MVDTDAINRLSSDQREDFEERAAIMQFCGGMSKERAEAEAFKRIKEKEQSNGKHGRSVPKGTSKTA